MGVRCPYCFYEMVPEPKWIGDFFSFFGRSERRAVVAEPKNRVEEKDSSLCGLPLGKAARITRLKFQDRRRLQKVLTLGALPGSEIVLVQKYPSYVFRIGHSQFSVDHELASSILVAVV